MLEFHRRGSGLTKVTFNSVLVGTIVEDECDGAVVEVRGTVQVARDWLEATRLFDTYNWKSIVGRRADTYLTNRYEPYRKPVHCKKWGLR
jgi:hypothetical protein